MVYLIGREEIHSKVEGVSVREGKQKVVSKFQAIFLKNIKKCVICIEDCVFFEAVVKKYDKYRERAFVFLYKIRRVKNKQIGG